MVNQILTLNSYLYTRGASDQTKIALFETLRKLRLSGGCYSQGSGQDSSWFTANKGVDAGLFELIDGCARSRCICIRAEQDPIERVSWKSAHKCLEIPVPQAVD
jgi:hypothetical protein